MDERLVVAFALVRADMGSSGVNRLVPLDLDRVSHIQSNYDDGYLDESGPHLVQYVADEVQDLVIHRLWQDVQQPTNWPVCPRHPTTHPLKPVPRDDHAVWVCPASDEVIASIGDLQP